MSARAAPDREQGGAALRIDTTIAVVLVGFRLVAALWLTVLGAIALGGKDDPETLVVVGAIAAAWAWTGATAWMWRRRPRLLTRPAWLIPDLAVAMWVLAAPALDGSADAINYSGGFPASSVLLWAYAWSHPGAVLAAVACSALIAVSDLYSVNGEITASMVYVITGLVVAWGIGVLRRNETLRMEAEAALAEERAQRLRSDERAELAARVHDSVLQTLALIQRRAGDSEEVAALARDQERSLRALLYDEREPGKESFAGAIEEAAAEVGRLHRIRVDVVTVGDCDLTEPLLAMVAAGREAITNAAKFSGEAEISVFAEVTPDGAAVFVRDRGRGFDPATVPAGRGILESIEGRMRRHGGAATVRSAPGAGTEVELTLSRSPT